MSCVLGSWLMHLEEILSLFFRDQELKFHGLVLSSVGTD